MCEQQFWAELQQYIYMYSDALETTQAQWERVVQLRATPSLPTQLIIKTACEGAVYLQQFAPLNFPNLVSGVSLSAQQQVALDMALSNSAIAAIVGYPATGKTRIATSLANVAITHQKRVLVLTHHSAALAAYANLPGYPFRLSQQQNYQQWIITQLRQRHLAQPQMDYHLYLF